MKPARFLPFAAVGLCTTSALAQWTLEPLWSLKPGDRSYLTTDNTQRGLDYNPATGNVLLLSRAGGLGIYSLSGATGAEVGTLDLGGALITGGTFAASMIGVGGDGAIYAGNLSLNTTTTPFKLYRWANEAAVPTLAFEGDPSTGLALGGNNSKRFGDTMAVRGSGADTQVLLAARGGGDVGVLLTADGVTFTGAGVDTDVGVNAADNSSDIGLGVDFGSGNTLWGTALGRSLRQVDLNVGTSPFSGTTIGNFGADQGVPTSVTLVGVDPSTGLLAGVDIVTGPDKVALYDISTGTPILLDTETLTTDTANANGVGAVAFGDGKLFVLDANNGIHAYSVVQAIPEPGTLALLGLGAFGLLLGRRR